MTTEMRKKSGETKAVGKLNLRLKDTRYGSTLKFFSKMCFLRINVLIRYIIRCNVPIR